MSKTIHLAIGQFPGRIGHADENTASVARLAAAAARQGAQFILFPEDCLSGYPGEPGSARAVAIDADGPEIRQLSRVAHGHGIAIAAGMIERAGGDRLHSAHVIAWADGKRTIIRKRSVDARDQRIGLSAAEAPNPDFEIAGPGGVPAALAICMDGTDEFFAAAKARGVRIILHPSGGPCFKTALHASDPNAASVDAAEVKACRSCLDAAREKARQLNAAYCVANSVGFDGERGYPGNSWIVSPGGEVLAYLPGTAIIEQMREGVGVAKVSFE